MGIQTIWVDDSDEFERLAKSWLQCEILAIDTEFERRTTYYPLLALLQVFDGQAVYLIDPLKLDCPDSFRAVCQSDTVLKVMHSAREDLESLYHVWGCQLNALFDTQLANAFISGEISRGYAPLVEQLCGQKLDKEETQSDWMQRPLSDKQLRYAVNDVLFLPQLHHLLQEQLAEQTFYELFQAECRELCQLVMGKPDYQQDYRTAKDVWRLNESQLCLFKRLYQWRSETAIKENRTPNHILREPQLVELCISQPCDRNSLYKTGLMHPRSFRHYWRPLTQQVAAFVEEPSLPIKRVSNPRDVTGLKQLTDAFAKVVKNKAESLGVNSSILASKRIIRRIAFAKLTDEALPLNYSGWRGELLKTEFDKLFSKYSASISAQS